MSDIQIGKLDQKYLNRMPEGAAKEEMRKVFLADAVKRAAKLAEGSDFTRRMAERRASDLANPVAVLELPAREKSVKTFKNGKTKTLKARPAYKGIKVCPNHNGKVTSVLLSGGQAKWLVENIDKVKALISSVPE